MDNREDAESGVGGHSPEKVVWVCPAVKTPLFTHLPPLFRFPVAAGFSSFDPHFEQKYQIEICQNLKNFQLCSLNLA